MLVLCADVAAQKSAPRKSAVPARQPQFVITGTIPGTVEGAEVCLWLREYGNDALARTKIKNHSFRLTGHVASPTLCQLFICDSKDPKSEEVLPPERGFVLMVDNVPMRVSAPSFRALPLVSPRDSDTLDKEFAARVDTKGFAQTTYSEFRHYIHDVDVLSTNAYMDYSNYSEKKNPESSVLLAKRQAMLQARVRYEEAENRFVKAHPTYPISLMLMQPKTEETFEYTDADYDAWLAMFKDNKDTVRYRAFAAAVAEARHCPKGKAYTDFDVLTPDSVQGHLSQYLQPNGYTIVDLWASWCGWCRKAIPHIKEMYAKYDRSKLTILSISTDNNKKDWYRAMKEEAMPWQQLLLAPQSSKLVEKAYNLYGIPDFLLIDAQGKVVFATSSPDELDEEVGKALR